MKVLIATDKFKDALTATAAASAMAAGVAAALPAAKIAMLPLSDGGEGFASLTSSYTGAKKIAVEVTGPLQQPLTATYAWLPRQKRACIEMAEAAGLQLVPPQLRSPLHTTTYGVGELIRHALGMGATEIVLGIGGSATHDLGTGMAAALGYRFLDKEGRPFLPTGGSLLQISSISTAQVNKQLQSVNIQVACDVSNPLTGPTGAAYSYGLQKGATDKQLALLDQGALHLAALLERDLHQELLNVPGSGAAGGMGAGAIAFLGATLLPGATMLLELANFTKKVAEADLVITGEGSADAQSLQGKLIGEVARQTAAANKPLLLLCGRLELCIQQLYEAPFWHAIALSPPGEDLKQSLFLCRQRLIAAAQTGMHQYLKHIKKPRNERG